MTKYAVILQTNHNKLEFRSTFGFFNKQIHDLQQSGYKILQININEIACELNLIQSSSVGFMWIRMHGSPQSMSATKDLQINIENYADIFQSLPRILSDNACIFLQSCSTGYLLPDFNNIQFAFAKLTLEKPMVQIVAPSKNLHVDYFCIKDDGTFYFEMTENNRLNEKNIAIVITQETKAIMTDAVKQNISLESKAEEIKKSLQIHDKCPFLDNFKNENHENFSGSFDLTTVLINTIANNFEDYDDTLTKVKKLIEQYHASPNYEKDYVRVAASFRFTSPLATAIFYKHDKVANFLLNNGADPFHSFNNETILNYAKKIDENAIERVFYIEESIRLRREKMNDHSKMTDVITKFLESREEHQKSAYIRHCLWSSINNIQSSVDEVSANILGNI